MIAAETLASGGVPPKVIVSLGGQTPLKLSGVLPRGADRRHVAGVDRPRRGPREVERAVHTSCASRSRPAAPRSTSSRRWRSSTRSGSRCSCARATCSAGGRCRSSTTATTSRGRWPSWPGSAASGARAGCRPSGPVLIDRFLEDATEVDVDAIRDHTGEVLIGGVMEHVEEAGVHSGDSACAIPPQTLPPWVVEVIESYTTSIAKALDVRGLINVQYAVLGTTVYVIEANPRASRTVPFVAKATGVPLAKVASRVMLGATLAELRAEGLLRPPSTNGHVVDQGGGAAVQPLPRGRPGARPGDALDRRGDGHRHHVRPGVLQGRAGRRHGAADRRAPCSCRSPTATSRPASSSPSGCASSASASPPRRARPTTSASFGVSVDQVVGKVCDGARHHRRRPDRRRQDRFVVNTPAGPRRRAPTASRSARRPTLHRVSSVTTVAAALAAVQGMAEQRGDRSTVRSLQEYHAAMTRHVRSGRTGDRSTQSTTPVRVGSVELRQPGDDGVGDGGARRRAGAVLRPRRRSARVVVKSLAAFEWAGNPAPRVHPTPARDDQRRRPAGPRCRALAAPTTCPRCSTPAPRVVASIWGRIGRRVPAAPPSCWPARRRASSPSRSTCRARTSRARRGDLRPRPRAVGRGDRGHRRLRPAAVGQAQRQHRPHRRGRRRRARRRRRGGDADQHAARAW